MRVYLLFLVVVGVALYARRNWFTALCALVVLDALMKQGDMPRSMLGIQGANFFNLLFAVVLVGWLVGYVRQPLPWNVPRGVVVLALAYVVVIVVAGVRGLMDVDGIRIARDDPMKEADITAGFFASEYLVNPLKYSLAAALLFYGSRTRANALQALVAVAGQALFGALLVIRWVPLEVLLESGESPYRARIQRECGLHANDMALVLVVGFWAVVALLTLLKGRKWYLKAAALGAGATMLLALALTNSRAGYLAMLALGLIFGVIRWRRQLVLVPVAAVALCVVFPAIPARLGAGFGQTTVDGDDTNWDTVTAGRTTNIWPATEEQIAESPVIGFGRLGIVRTPLYDRIMDLEDECPMHPHNAYLEMLLDAGAIALPIPVGLFVIVPLICLVRGRSSDALIDALMLAGVAGTLALAIMGISGQSFFPREGIFLALCAYALLLRAWVTARNAAALRATTALRMPTEPVYGVPA